MKLSETGEPEHYFDTKDFTNLIKKTSKEIIGKIAELLFELSLKSFDKAVKDKDHLESDDEHSDEESKVFKDQTPLPDDVYEKKLDLFTFNYLLTQKVHFLQNLIRSMYWNQCKNYE